MHSYIPELTDQFRKGKISRREFIRMATLLGVSVGTASVLAACSSEETTVPTTASQAAPTTAATMAPTAIPTAVPVAGPKRGGEITIAEGLLRFDDPHLVLYTEKNVVQNVAEHLIIVNTDNVVQPWLLESWDVSDDLTVWTLNLRKGVTFNTGAELIADDVVWNFQRWLNPDVGSAMVGLMDYLSPTNVEKVDDYTVKLHLDRPQIGVAEHLFFKGAVVLPRDFEGNWMDNPVGTGPYTLEEYFVEERAYLKRREGYWRNGADGSPLPYLDGIRYIYLSDDAAKAAALLGGEIDMTLIKPPQLDVLEGSGVVAASSASSTTTLVRMRADVAPFDDVRVRNAIKACQDRPKFLEVTNRGIGALGEDHHVAPIQPDYCPMPVPERDIEKAKALLAEAGYADGLTVDLACIDGDRWSSVAQLLKEACEPAGITININTMPSSMYWEQWTDVSFGVTNWAHRSLAIETLSLAYKSGAAWNETHWSNERFDELLMQAERTLDVDQRREIMCEIQTIMKEEGTVAVPFFEPVMWGHTPRVKGFESAPHDHCMLSETWLDDEA